MQTQTPAISADWTVDEVVGVYPTALPTLGRHGIDTCCGGLKTLSQVAAAHHLDLDQMLADLRAVTAPAPLVLDVRPELRAGREPFALIMNAVDQLGADQDLVLLVDFEPLPLYRVLGERGFAHQTERTADGAWKVTFSRKA